MQPSTRAMHRGKSSEKTIRATVALSISLSVCLAQKLFQRAAAAAATCPAIVSSLFFCLSFHRAPFILVFIPREYLVFVFTDSLAFLAGGCTDAGWLVEISPSARFLNAILRCSFLFHFFFDDVCEGLILSRCATVAIELPLYSDAF